MSTIKLFSLISCCVAVLSTASFGTELKLKPMWATESYHWEGEEIILEHAGQAVVLEIRVDDWHSSVVTGLGICGDLVTVCDNPGGLSLDCGPSPDGLLCYANDGLMRGWQAKIDSSALGGVLWLSIPECDDNADCQIYGNDYPVGATCNFSQGVCYNTPTNSACVFIQKFRSDFVFDAGANAVVNVDNLYYLAASLSGYAYADVGYCEDDPTLRCNVDDKCCEDDATIVCDVDQDCIDEGAEGPCVEDPTCRCLAGGALGPCARDMYCGTLALDVPAVGAAGTYTIGFIDDPAYTDVTDADAISIVPLNLVPAVITVKCTDQDDCDDGDMCTNDSCMGTGECQYTYNFNVGLDGIPYTEDDVECCDPETGSTVLIDDGNECTEGECDPETGQVTQNPLDAGTPCGGPPSGECDAQDTCDGEGTCVENFAPYEEPCGSGDDTDCTDPDFCDGAGTCLDNHEPVDTACGSGLDDDCTDPDTCDGDGNCQDNHEPPDTPCEDPTAEQCNDPDTCDGAGVCLDNYWPNDSDCDDGLYCTVDEYCTNGSCGDGEARDCSDGIPCTTDWCNEELDQCVHDIDSGFCLIGGICRTEGEDNPANDCEECDTSSSTTSWSPKPIDDPCGGIPGQADTDCTDPDTCDGAGTCEPNHEPVDTPCGDPSDTDCTDPDTCDGNGNCLDNHEPDETDCDDGLYCNVGEECTDGNCGGGSARDCSDSFSCTDDSCNEGGGTCVNTPNNAHCDDAQYCNGVEICAPGAPGADPVTGCVVQSGSVPDCDDLVECTDDWCNEVIDECVNDPNDANCDDGQYCNGDETCDPDLDCQPGTDVDCDDGFDCTDDSCNEVSDQCDNIPNDLLCPDDGLWCNGDEICDPENPDPELPVSGCGHGPEPCGGPCDEENDVCLCEAPIAVAASSRYLTITPLPAEADTKMALLVTGDCPGGITQWVSVPVPFDRDGDGSPDALLGFLMDGVPPEEAYLTPAEWGGTVYVTGADLAPGMSYIIHADCGTPGTPGLSDPGTTETWAYGNVDGDPAGAVTVVDLMLCIAGFQADFSAVTMDKADQMAGEAPLCQPDQVLGLTDIMQVIRAFQVVPYQCGDLCP